MKRVDPYVYVELGSQLNDVLKLDPKTTFMNCFWELTNLGTTLANLSDDPALVSKPIENAMTALHEKIIGLMQQYSSQRHSSMAVTKNDPPPLPVFTPTFLHSSISDLRTALRQGLPTLNLFSASPQGTHDIGLLMESASQVTFGELATYIPEFVFRDYDEAGRCLAFGLYTAAGYHSARACEGMLEQYSMNFLDDPKSGKQRTMGQMIHLLENIDERPMPDPKILDRARRLKDHDRNDLAHAGVFLEPHDARSVFGVAGELIGMIASRHHKMAKGAAKTKE